MWATPASGVWIGASGEIVRKVEFGLYFESRADKIC